MFVYRDTADDSAESSSEASRDKLVARLPAGLRSKQKLLRALATKLQLPHYFGQNWDALEECLADFSWFPQKKIELVHADLPLYTGGDQLGIYLSVLASACERCERLTVIFPTSARQQVEETLAGER